MVRKGWGSKSQGIHCVDTSRFNLTCSVKHMALALSCALHLPNTAVLTLQPSFQPRCTEQHYAAQPKRRNPQPLATSTHRRRGDIGPVPLGQVVLLGLAAQELELCVPRLGSRHPLRLVVLEGLRGGLRCSSGPFHLPAPTAGASRIRAQGLVWVV